jgi:hypothetical protein
MALSERDLQALTRLVDRQAAGRERFSRNLAGRIRRLLRGLVGDGFYDEVAVQRFARQAAEVSRAGQQATSDLTRAYIAESFRVLTVDPPTLRPPLEQDLRGVPSADVWQRPAKEYRYQRSRGLDGLAALAKAEERAEKIARDELALAMRETSRQILQASKAVVGYRRVIHPELSQTGVCGLCIAAATRVYRKQDLLPMHDRCKCEVVAVTAADAGEQMNRRDLDALYKRAAAASSGLDRGSLKRVRFVIVQHGELGPVLREAGDGFRGPADVAANSRAA